MDKDFQSAFEEVGGSFIIDGMCFFVEKRTTFENNCLSLHAERK